MDTNELWTKGDLKYKKPDPWREGFLAGFSVAMIAMAVSLFVIALSVH